MTYISRGLGLPIVIGLAAATAIALGAGAVLNPPVALLLEATILGLAALGAPAGAWVIASLTAALTFKGLVSVGALPSLATYLDIPLAWGALLVGLLKRNERSPFLSVHLRWLAALGVVIAAAWAFNPSEVLRPFVYLMLLGEPFAIVGALLADPPSPRVRLALERTLLALVLIQIPFVAIEFLKFGPADPIQGTLYHAGAGAHVISAVIVVGAIWIFSGGIGRSALGVTRVPVLMVLCAIPFLADAKQVIAALPAIVVAANWRAGATAVFTRTAFAVVCVVALFSLDPAGKTAATFVTQAQHGQGGKSATAVFLMHKLDGDPASLVFGKGPAETVSRAAFMTTAHGGPLTFLGLHPATIAIEAENAALTTASHVNGATSLGDVSSFNSGISSTLGVFGDIGIAGMVVYLGLFGSLFLRLRSTTSPEGIAAAAGFALFFVLGLVFDWWEQPPFGVFLGALAGLALTKPSPASSGRNRKQLSQPDRGLE